jgi:oligopeptidase B
MTSFPIPPKHPHEITQHGQTRVDDYYWMRDKNNPETMKHLRAESDYLEEMMQHTKPLQEKLFAEMKARIKETDASVPEKRGEYFYYTRHEAGKQYPIFCRKHGALDAAEEILLDQNQLAEGKSFCSVSGFAVSPDGKKLAYGVDWGGSEEYTMFIKDLATGKLYPESVDKTLGSAYERIGLEWGNDSETVFYVTLNDSQRPEKLFSHKIGTNPKDDVLIYHEADEAFFLYFFKTRDDAYIMTFHHATDSREMRFLDANHPDGELKILQPRVNHLEYFAAHHKGKFFIVHNDNAKNFKLSVAPLENCGKENWKDVIPHRDDVLVEMVDAFADFIVVSERKGGVKQLRISAADGVSNVRYVPFPEPSYNVYLEANPQFETNLVRLNYSSLITPISIIDYHVDTGEWEVKKEEEIPSGYDKSQYVAERIHATAPDGTKVPMSIVYKKGLKKDGSNPALMYGYGAYGATIDAWFNHALFSLIDRGFVFGIAHIRGGYDMGRDWYDQGKMMNKMNTFTDFIACAEHLIAEGFTSKEKLSIEGASAGGLLVTACTTIRPDLFKAVVARVPFTDVVTTMSDPTIPLTTLEYNQWGNPENKEHFDYLMNYSPYDNIRATAYPDMFITTGLNDPRVAFWEPAKFAAKLRETKTNDSLIVFYVNYDSGHAGASGRYDYLKELAQYYAFLIDRLGVK